MWDDGMILLHDIDLAEYRVGRAALERRSHIARQEPSPDEAPPRRALTTPRRRRGLRGWLHWLRWKEL
jgi:hypothetical protein